MQNDKTFGEKQGQDLISFLNNLAIEGGYVFRGYTKQDELFPSLTREIDNRHIAIKEWRFL